MNDLWLAPASRAALDRSVAGVAARVAVVTLSVAFWIGVLSLTHLI